jgi:hypothetical protein
MEVEENGVGPAHGTPMVLGVAMGRRGGQRLGQAAWPDRVC